MPRLRPLLMLSTLPMILACSPTTAKSASAQREVCEGEPAEAGQVSVAPVAAPPITVTNTNGAVIGAGGADAGAVASTGADGWVVADGGIGIQRVPRAQAIARVAAAPVRVLLEPTIALDECRNAVMTHAYFQVPASSAPKPFQAAVVVGEVLPWGHFATRKELYVAGVRVGTLQAPQVDSCHGPMPPRDAAVIALVPVRNAGEGLRLLERMH